jgi:hypothetical protein
MIRKKHKPEFFLGMVFLLLVTLACGSVQFGVVTPTVEAETLPVNQGPEPEPEQLVVEEEAAPAPVEALPKLTEPITVTAWLGHIALLPEGSQFDDMVVLSPQGTGEFGLVGATPEIEAEIPSLRDGSGSEEFVHLWGTLSCEVDDYNGCQLVVDQIQSGANYSEEEIVVWTGTIKGSTFNDGPTHIFELSGNYPMWFSIHASQDEALQSVIETLRDTGAVVEVSGQLLVGIPDVNGTRIEVETLEVLKPGTLEQPEVGAGLDITADWPVFINDRYSYQIKHPMGGVISLFGPLSFSMDDVPEDMSPEQYLDSLQKEYTDRLCVEIKYSLGWIYNAAPPNKGKGWTPCGPTGIGAGEIINKIEITAVGDLLYQTNGTEFKLQMVNSDGIPYTGETLDMHGEMYRIELEDGTVIRFGSQPRHDATYEDYLMKTKETLLQIISTYEGLE